MKLYEVEKNDVLIIGAGGAGTRAAIACAERGVKTTLLTKGLFGKSGITIVGFGGLGGNFDQPGDSPEIHLQDIVRSGKFLCDQDVAAVMADECQDAIRYCEQLGVKYWKTNGEYQLFLLPGFTVPRCLNIYGGGYALLRSLKKKAKQYTARPPLIDVREDVVISMILVKDNRAYGAIGLDVRNGMIRVYHCKALILAAGGAGYLWPNSDCPPESVGDAFSLAYHAGVKIVNLEQQLFYPTVCMFPQPIRGLEVSYDWCLNKANPKLGGWLVNGKGEVFYPFEEVGTRDFITHIVAKEIKEGRGGPHGGVYLDITGCSESRKTEIVGILNAHKRLLQNDIDIRKQKLEVAPGAHTTLGGAKIDPETRTNVIGLFACGEATGNVHGANRLAGHSYLETQVFGARAGRSAAEFAKEADWTTLDKPRIEEECSNLNSYLGEKKDGISAAELKNKIIENTGEYIGPIRNKDGLAQAVETFSSIRSNDLPRVDAPNIREYNSDWAEAIEVKHMLDCAEMVARCALLREESRGTHFREDFPYMDNENPVKHTLVQLIDGKMEFTTEPVRMTKFEPPKEKCPAF